MIFLSVEIGTSKRSHRESAVRLPMESGRSVSWLYERSKLQRVRKGDIKTTKQRNIKRRKDSLALL